MHLPDNASRKLIRTEDVDEDGAGMIMMMRVTIVVTSVAFHDSNYGNYGMTMMIKIQRDKTLCTKADIKRCD